MARYTLMTGATGLVGRYLIRDLLLDGVDLALVIRSAPKQTVMERIEQILQFWERELGKSLPRPVVLAGDVCAGGLGLSRSDRRWVARHCDSVIHNAASLTFHGADRAAEPWRTNLDGTWNLLNFCEEAGIHQLHYVSTAYVSGAREGTIYESELDCGQTFRNEYEESKFFAEKALRSAAFLDQLTVYRPAVIAGDSRTGYTSTYHGLYMYLQLMSVLNRNTEPDEHGIRHTDIRLNMTGDEPRNIVPVDWISSVIAHLFGHREAHGGTYHLSPAEPVTPCQIVEAGCRFFNSCGVEFCGAGNELNDTISRAERATYDNKSMYESYEHSDPIFDTTNLQRMAPDLPCPNLDEAMLHRFLRYGEEDRWGRRKPPDVSVPGWAVQLVPILAREVLSAFLVQQRHHDQPCTSLGLNLTGPGGGQWTISRDELGEITVEMGLPPEDRPVVQSSALEFLQIAAIRAGTPAASNALRFEMATIT